MVLYTFFVFITPAFSFFGIAFLGAKFSKIITISLSIKIIQKKKKQIKIS